VFELRAGNARGDDDQDADKQRSDCQSTEPDGSGYLCAWRFRFCRRHSNLPS